MSIRNLRPDRLILATTTLLLISGVGAAHAQEVRGTVQEAGTGRPIPGAFISLLDPTDQVVGSTLASPVGAFTVLAPGPGTYRLEVARIGYETWRSASFQVEDQRAVDQQLQIPVRAIDVAEIRVSVQSRCELKPGAGERVLLVWNEIAKALDLTRWTEQPGRIQFELRVWDRELDVMQRVSDRGHSQSGWKTGRSTFLSLPPEELAETGYVRKEDGKFTFFAPDATTILSPDFQERHCFRLVDGGLDAPGVLGLAFEPVERELVPDVEGVFWLNRDTGELSHMTFDYVDLDLLGLPDEHWAGGRVEYRRLPPGIWIVSDWWIRNPILAITETRTIGGVSRMSLRGYREDGGEILKLALGNDRVLDLTDLGTISGRVIDASGEPLGNAMAFLLGTHHVTEADDAGRFRFELVEPGSYQLRFQHPDPAAEGAQSYGETIEVTGGEVSSVLHRFSQRRLSNRGTR